MYARIRTEWRGYKVRVYHNSNVDSYRCYSVVFKGPNGLREVITTTVPNSKKFPRMRALRDVLQNMWNSLSESEPSEYRNAVNVLWLSAYDEYRWLTRDGDNW